MALGNTGMSAGELLLAEEIASSFRGDASEICRFLNEHCRVGVSRAAKLQIVAQIIILAKYFDDLVPHRNACCGLGVPNDVHAMLRSGKEDIDPVGRLKEADLVFVVAADQ